MARLLTFGVVLLLVGTLSCYGDMAYALRPEELIAGTLREGQIDIVPEGF